MDYHVLLMPVIQSSTGGFYGIMEFMRNEDDSPFFDEDEEIVNSYLVTLMTLTTLMTLMTLMTLTTLMTMSRSIQIPKE